MKFLDLGPSTGVTPGQAAIGAAGTPGAGKARHYGSLDAPARMVRKVLVSRGAPAAELVQAVSRAARGQASMPAEVMAALAAEPGQLVELTAKEVPSDQGHFQAILDSAPEAIIVVDHQGLIIFANAGPTRSSAARAASSWASRSRRCCRSVSAVPTKPNG